jgi:ubiquinol-cytochrome c reductase cytochrome b subunit
LFPFLIVGLVLVHITLLHSEGSSNPLGIESTTDRIPFSPYFIVKDVFGLMVLFIAFFYFVFFAPNALGHPDN